MTWPPPSTPSPEALKGSRPIKEGYESTCVCPTTWPLWNAGSEVGFRVNWWNVSCLATSLESLVLSIQSQKEVRSFLPPRKHSTGLSSRIHSIWLNSAVVSNMGIVFVQCNIVYQILVGLHAKALSPCLELRMKKQQIEQFLSSLCSKKQCYMVLSQVINILQYASKANNNAEKRSHRLDKPTHYHLLQIWADIGFVCNPFCFFLHVFSI